MGGGFEYGTAGPTHYGIEDVGVMRLLQDMAVVAPADGDQAATAVGTLSEWPGPAYLRLGKNDRLHVPGLDGRFELGRGSAGPRRLGHPPLRDGGYRRIGRRAAEDLEREGISAAVVVIASVHPAPTDDIERLVSTHRKALTVEAHVRNGGIGSLVAEVIAESGARCRLVRLGVDRPYGARGGSEAFLHEWHGLSPLHRRSSARALEVGVGPLKTESFRPVANTPPTTLAGKARFYGRMLVDLQVLTVYRDLRRHLPDFRGEVLDVGCGQSPYRFLLDAHATHYVGIDILDADRFDYVNDDIVPFDGEHIPFADAQFDAVVCTEVLEHVPHFQLLVNEIHRVLKDGGRAVFTVPWSARYHYVPYDYFRYTPSSLRSMFAQFDNVAITPARKRHLVDRVEAGRSLVSEPSPLAMVEVGLRAALDTRESCLDPRPHRCARLPPRVDRLDRRSTRLHDRGVEVTGPG